MGDNHDHDRVAARYVQESPRKAAALAAKRAVSALEFERASSDALYAALDAAKRCRVCGTHMENEDSVRLRVGPECRSKADFGVGRIRTARRQTSDSNLVDVVLDTDTGPVAGVVDATVAPFDALFRDGVRAFTLAVAFAKVDVAYHAVFTGPCRAFAWLRHAEPMDYPPALPAPVSPPFPADAADALTARWTAFTTCLRFGLPVAAGVAA